MKKVVPVVLVVLCLVVGGVVAMGGSLSGGSGADSGGLSAGGGAARSDAEGKDTADKDAAASADAASDTKGSDADGSGSSSGSVLSQEDRRRELALAFAWTWNTTAEMDDPNDFSTISEWQIPGWYESCLAYIAPGSALYAEFQKAEQGLFEGPGVIAALTVTKSAELVAVEGDTYTARVVFAGTNGAVPGWYDNDVEQTQAYTFDENDKIVRIATEYSTWG